MSDCACAVSDTAGCDQPDTGLIWYDEEIAACYSDDEYGKTVEVPCDEENVVVTDDDCFIILSNGKTAPVACEDACFIILSNGKTAPVACEEENPESLGTCISCG